jgi:hypothetical protein
MSLIEWHQRLSSNFQALRQCRVANSGTPLFALEHGLAQQELSKLESEIRAYIQKYSPTENSWLPWIVYSAELGYRYVGLEYWQTFEAETVGWRERGSREWIRAKFKTFENDYGGVVPSGPWAEHFSIICHPITHAILPRDFQSQLADVLASIQHLFTVENLQDPKLLGQLIRSYSFQQSRRFQQFVQDVEVVGLITQALLGNEEDQTSEVLVPATLSRIVDNLEEVALDQLHDARRRAHITRLRGISRQRGVREPGLGARQIPSQDDSDVQPSLLLRRTGSSSWDAYLEIPDFSILLVTHPSWRRFLEGTRVEINGARGMLPRGTLLFGTTVAQLRSYPTPEKELLKFEDDRSPDDLTRLLSHTFSLRAGSMILCRIANDGLAHQMRGSIVRPSREYLVLSTVGPIKSNAFTSPIDLSCQGLHGVRLSVPREISSGSRIAIERLGLQVAREISVFPVGVPAAKWDDEDYAEWLTTDDVCVGIHSYYSIEKLQLDLDGEESSTLEVETNEAAYTTFVQLPPLEKGEYVLHVSVGESLNEELEELGDLRFRIREPRAWKSAIYEQGALFATIDPPQPTLEQLMRGVVGVELHGPLGHPVRAVATLFGKNRTDRVGGPFGLPELHLPLKLNSGRAYLSKLAHNSEFQSASDSAVSCRLDIDAGELGTISYMCEREFTPLRWLVTRQNNSYRLSLSDDSGASKKPAITHYDFHSPDWPMPIAVDLTKEHYGIPSSGGLYFAQGDGIHCSIIFPHEVNERMSSFADMKSLVVHPKFRSAQRSSKALQEALMLIRMWSEAHTIGNLVALLARQRILQAIVTHIFGVICGPTWIAAENSYMDHPNRVTAALNFGKAIHSSDVAASLVRQSALINKCTPKERAANLAQVLGKFIKPLKSTTETRRVGAVISKGPRWQAEFALRLGSAPESLDYWAHNWCIPGLQSLLDNPLLARAARFMVLTSSYELQKLYRSQDGSLYTGWDWI